MILVEREYVESQSKILSAQCCNDELGGHNTEACLSSGTEKGARISEKDLKDKDERERVTK